MNAGLTTAEAARSLGEHGPNELRRADGTSAWRLLLAQFKSALVALLAPDGNLKLDMQDDIIAAVCVTTEGQVRNASISQKLSEASA